MNLKKLIQTGDDEDLVNLGVDRGQAELAGLVTDPVVDGDQGAQGGGGEVIHVGEADEQAGRRFLIDDPRDLVADELDVGFVEYVAVDELDLNDGVLLADAKAGVGGRHRSCS